MNDELTYQCSHEMLVLFCCSSQRHSMLLLKFCNYYMLSLIIMVIKVKVKIKVISIKIIILIAFVLLKIYKLNTKILQNMQKTNKVVHLSEEDKKDQRKIIVVLQKARLEIATMKKKETVLLNGEDHANYISNKLKKDPAQYRPDITHQCLLTLLDSPLNKAGKLQVYITTTSNQVIKIHHATRIPRTYKRFSSLFAQLLKRLSIRAQQSSQTLLQIVKSPVTLHLPSDCLKIAFSTKARLVDMSKYAKQINNDKPVVFVIGAVAKGNPTMQVDYINDSVCISKYALSASVCLGRIMYSFEMLYGII